MFNRLGSAAPTWLDRWLTPLPVLNIVRAYSVHPRYCRWADWQIDAALDDNLEHALMAGHSIIGLYVAPTGAYVPLPVLWAAAYYEQQPKISAVVKQIMES